MGSKVDILLLIYLLACLMSVLQIVENLLSPVGSLESDRSEGEKNAQSQT